MQIPTNLEKRRARDRAYHAANREKRREYLRAYYRANREKALAVAKGYYLENREKCRADQQKYYQASREQRRAYVFGYYAANREKIVARNTRRYRERVRSDPEFRVTVNLRKRVWDAVVRGAGGKKSARTKELVGCTRPELRAHLEKQFRPGMTWENYGAVWHMDHIKPCAKFDLLDAAQQRECFHYTNMQPLFAEENLKKGAR